MKTTNYDEFSDIAIQYGVIDSVEKIAVKVTKEQQFNEAMKLVEQLDKDALGVISLYIDVLLREDQEKAA